MDQRALALDAAAALRPRSAPRPRAARRRRRGSRRRLRRRRCPSRRSRSPSGRSARTRRRGRARVPPGRARARRSSSRSRSRSRRSARSRDRQREVRAGRNVQAGRRAAQVAQLDPCAGRPARPARRRHRGTRAGRSRRRAPCRCTLRSSSRHAGGKRPPWVATPTRAVVGLEAERVVDRGHDRDAALRLPRPRRVEHRDDRLAPVARARRAPSCRSADRPRTPQRGRAACSDTQPGLSAGTWTPSRSSTPGHGSSASSRLPSRSTWSHRGATQRRPRSRGPTRPCSRASRRARAHAPRGPSARASRMPPDLASLMLTPCAISAHARDVGERVAVLVDVDRNRRALASASRRPDRPRGSGCSQYSTPSSASCGSASSASSSDHHSLTSTCSGSVGHGAHGANALDVEAVARRRA